MKVSKVFVAIGFVAAICFTAPQAKADVITDNIGKLISGVKGLTSKSQVQAALCKKASLFSAKISLRSLDGKLCVGPLGAFAILLCKKYSDSDGPFTDSSCYKKAVESVGRGDPEAGAATLLANSLKDTASASVKVIKPLVCTVGPFALDVTGVGAPVGVALGAACGAVDLVK